MAHLVTDPQRDAADLLFDLPAGTHEDREFTVVDVVTQLWLIFEALQDPVAGVGETGVQRLERRAKGQRGHERPGAGDDPLRGHVELGNPHQSVRYAAGVITR